MKKIERQMSLIIGTILSFVLSLIGIISSEKPSIVSFLICFVMSVILSIVIGSVVPLRSITEKVTGSMNLQKGSLGSRAVESLLSDVIFTPVITLAMVILAYAMSHGHMPFVPAFVGSLVKGLVIGFIILFIITPAVLKFVLSKNGITMGGPQGGPPQGE